MNKDNIIKNFELLYSPENVAGMARFGIRPEKNYGISLKDLRPIAKEIGKDHRLALELWSTGIRDAQLLAVMISDPAQLTESEADKMVKDLVSWDVCDGFCMWLVRYSTFAYGKAEEWSSRESEFEKRAAFALIASLAVSDKKAPDSLFEHFLPMMERESSDSRNYVRKAVNWALRGIGKRNAHLNGKAIALASKLQASDSKAARWIGNDAARELESEAVQKRLRRNLPSQKKRNGATAE